MKNDKRIEEQMDLIKQSVDEWVGYVKSLNQCAYTDRVLETLILRIKELERLYNEDQVIVPQFNHIKDCWDYLKGAEDYNDLLKRIGNLPQWSGTWDVEKSIDAKCDVINSYYDKQCENWERDEEWIDIRFDREE